MKPAAELREQAGGESAARRCASPRGCTPPPPSRGPSRPSSSRPARPASPSASPRGRHRGSGRGLLGGRDRSGPAPDGAARGPGHHPRRAAAAIATSSRRLRERRSTRRAPRAGAEDRRDAHARRRASSSSTMPDRSSSAWKTVARPGATSIPVPADLANTSASP